MVRPSSSFAFRFSKIVANAVRSASEATAHPSFSETVDLATLTKTSDDFSRIARAIGCSVDDLTAYISASPSLDGAAVPVVTHKSLTIPDGLRKSFMDWTNKDKPITIKTAKSKAAYSSPIGINNAFQEALALVNKDRISKYDEVLQYFDKIDALLAKHGVTEIANISKPSDRNLAYNFLKRIETLRVLAERNNPEAIHAFNRGAIDISLPIHRFLARTKWENYERLLLIQRLETLHVIPDTIAYFMPLINVKIRFPGTNAHWVEPGTILSTGVTAAEPEFSINLFENETKRYTIVIVDPDTPDLERDTFKTTLHYALANVQISGTGNPIVDKSTATELVSYLPPHPEKNSGNHRYAVWVFEQPNDGLLQFHRTPNQTDQEVADIEKNVIERDSFDIRKFKGIYKLKPVGAHLWRNGYDSKTEAVREKFGLGSGTVWHRVRLQHYQ
ncbi:phosphatidylethanolamine-binding protein [Lipomyces japonicus]|uniref:phosphatidylethanolamine-binding protein n=1 Tax=Lipomyces japonicus TaxID=56871 RepID=UPI0034CF4ADC